MQCKFSGASTCLSTGKLRTALNTYQNNTSEQHVSWSFLISSLSPGLPLVFYTTRAHPSPAKSYASSESDSRDPEMTPPRNYLSSRKPLRCSPQTPVSEKSTRNWNLQPPQNTKTTFLKADTFLAEIFQFHESYSEVWWWLCLGLRFLFFKLFDSKLKFSIEKVKVILHYHCWFWWKNTSTFSSQP